MASHGEWALFSLNNPWKLSKQSVSFSSGSVYRSYVLSNSAVYEFCCVSITVMGKMSYVLSNSAVYEFCCVSITVMGKMSEFVAVLFHVTP